MKVVFHDDFYSVYTSDPAAAGGRMESVVSAFGSDAVFVEAAPAPRQDIAAVHTELYIDSVAREGLYDIAALAAGGAIMAAEIGLSEPCFGLIRPPGHHASSASAWGFCFFNNMAVAITALRRRNRIKSAYVLDIDLHYGDGTVNILGKLTDMTVCNVKAGSRNHYLLDVDQEMEACTADLIGVSAGFDNHADDWGGLLHTEDYEEIGKMVRAAANRIGGGCFAILEGGYNHAVLGLNVRALMAGMAGG
jgi:acetoin utilization deacetylase AcuC-like enzyme